jgi:hypothetical protein
MLWEYWTRLGLHLSIHFGHDGYIASDRNNAIYHWLENETTSKLVQIDEDMIPPVDIWRLADSIDGEHHMVAAPYLFVGDKGFTISGEALDRKAVLPGAGLVEVGWFGTGAWATSRSAMEKMSAAEGAIVKFDVDELGRKRRGSDVYFCVRARALGFRTWINRDFVAGHRKGTTFAPRKDGSVSTLPWGVFWEGAEVPESGDAKRSINDLLRDVLDKYGVESCE